jgi:polyisoprenoid-binding protein YceI
MASLSEFFSDPASAGTWTIVGDQSTIEVKAKSMWGLVPVKGRFTEFSGDGQLTAPQGVSGSIDIKSASLRTGMKKRDEDLHSAKFFDTDKFPDIAVVINSAEPTEDDTVDLRAQLTVKGTTKPIALTAKVTPVGDGGMRVTAQGTVNRQDFGVDGNLVGMITDNVAISGDVVFRHSG